MSHLSPENGRTEESLVDAVFGFVDSTLGIFRQQRIAVTPRLIQEQVSACRFAASLTPAEREAIFQNLVQQWIPASTGENGELEAAMLGSPTEPGLFLQVLNRTWLPIPVRDASRVDRIAHVLTGRLERVIRRQAFNEGNLVWPPPLSFEVSAADPAKRSPAHDTVSRTVAAFAMKQPQWRGTYEITEVQNAFCSEAVEELLRAEVRRQLVEKLQKTFHNGYRALERALAVGRVKKQTIAKANNGERTEMIVGAVRIGVEALTDSTQQAVRDVVQGVLNSDRKG